MMNSVLLDGELFMLFYLHESNYRYMTIIEIRQLFCPCFAIFCILMSHISLLSVQYYPPWRVIWDQFEKRVGPTVISIFYVFGVNTSISIFIFLLGVNKLFIFSLKNLFPLIMLINMINTE